MRTRKTLPLINADNTDPENAGRLKCTPNWDEGLKATPIWDRYTRGKGYEIG
jgi:hypothetical protein